MVSSVGYGLKNAVRLWPLALLYWLLNAGLVWLMLRPMFHSLRVATEDSMIGEQLQGGLANWHFILEFLQREPTFFAAVFGTVLALSIVYLTLRFLMAGGVLAVVAGQCEGRFWQGVGRYAGRNLRLALWALLLLVILGVMIAVFQIGTALLLGATMGEEAGGVQGLLITTGFAVVLLFWFRLVLDFARAYLVASNSRSAFFCLRKGLAFVLTRPVKTVGLGLFFGLLGLGVVVFAAKLNPTFAATTLMAFLIHQGWLILRAGLRVGLFAGEYHLLSQQLAGQLAGSPDDEFAKQATTLSRQQAVQGGRVQPAAKPASRADTGGSGAVVSASQAHPQNVSSDVSA